MASEQYGHVKISRKAFEHDDLWLERREFSRWEAWVDLIQMAAWRRYEKLMGATTVLLERGEFIASRSYLAERWCWGEKKVRIYFAKTISDRLVLVRNVPEKGPIYLIVNYDTYQSTGPSKGQAGAEQGPQEKTVKQLSNTNTSPTDLLFDAIWHDYPKKEAKKDAKKAWDRLVARRLDLKVIEAGVYRYVNHLKAKGTERRFTKNLATFLNGECWTDVYEESNHGKLAHETNPLFADLSKLRAS